MDSFLPLIELIACVYTSLDALRHERVSPDTGSPREWIECYLLVKVSREPRLSVELNVSIMMLIATKKTFLHELNPRHVNAKYEETSKRNLLDALKRIVHTKHQQHTVQQCMYL